MTPHRPATASASLSASVVTAGGCLQRVGVVRDVASLILRKAFLFDVANEIMTRNPKRGLAFLHRMQLLDDSDSPEALYRFFSEQEGMERGWGKLLFGDEYYNGSQPGLVSQFLAFVDFEGMSIDDALRRFLHLAMPCAYGRALEDKLFYWHPNAVRSLVVEPFAENYCQDNPRGPAVYEVLDIAFDLVIVDYTSAMGFTMRTDVERWNSFYSSVGRNGKLDDSIRPLIKAVLDCPLTPNRTSTLVHPDDYYEPATSCMIPSCVVS